MYRLFNYFVSGGLKLMTMTVVYYITCIQCNLTYIGETQYAIQQRISQHLANIKTKSDTPVAQHFKDNHNIEDHFTCGVLAHNPNWSVTARKDREAQLIKKCNTLTPNGLNILKGSFQKRIVIPYTGKCNNIPTNKQIVYKNNKNLRLKFLIRNKKLLDI